MYPVSERGRKSRSADFPVRSIVRTPTCAQFAARLCERSFLRTGKSALRRPSLIGEREMAKCPRGVDISVVLAYKKTKRDQPEEAEV